MADYSATNQTLGAAGSGTLGVITIDMNKLGDTAIIVPFTKFYVEVIRLTNVSTTLAGTSATLGFFTGPGATGTTIVTAATGVVTPLTGATVVSSASIAASGVSVVPTLVNNTLRQIYANVAIAHGSAATLNAIIKILRIP